MTEIKLLTKIALIVDAIIWLIFGIILVFLYDITLNTEGWTNPLHVRMFGVLCLVTFVFAVLMLLKKEWEKIQFTFLYTICMCIGVLIIEISVFAVFGSTFLPTTISQMIFDFIILGAKITLSIVAYIKQ
jgi:hypothetical protein